MIIKYIKTIAESWIRIMQNFSNQKIKLFLIVYLGVVTYIIFHITGQMYGVNDDVIIQNWLSGSYTGKPEYMIRGSATPKMLFGILLSNLYSLMPQINWFSPILLGLVLISWYLLGIILLKQNKLFVNFSYVIISFLYLLWFIPSPTYTASAVILSFSVLTYISFAIRSQEFSKFLVLVFLLYALAYLVREESFFLGTFAGVTFFVFALLASRKSFKNTIRNTLFPVILFLTIVSSDYALENYFYQTNSDWATYKKWEKARYEIQANLPEVLVTQNPSKFGWTQSEVELFKSYNYIDPINFNVNKFDRLIQDSENADRDFYVNAYIENHQKIFSNSTSWEWKYIIALISLFYFIFLFLSLPDIRGYLGLTFISLLLLYSVMFYISLFLRQPERVYVSIIFLSILAIIFSFVFSSKNKSEIIPPAHLVITFLLFLLVLNNSYNQTFHLINKIQKSTSFFWDEQVEYLSRFPKDSIFVGNASQFRNNWASPYIASKSEVESRIFTFGWHNFSPHWYTRAQNLDLNANNLFQTVILDPRVYWVSDQNTMNFIINFMEENSLTFDGPTRVGVMTHFGDEYIVWDFNSDE